MNPVYRFAPSPTGYLHVGGARTALFNRVLASQTGGKFFLRIEDTDRKRSTDAAIFQIYDSLNWLGIDWDDDIWYQSQRRDRHIEVAEALLKKDKAYRCFCSKDELDQIRQEAIKSKNNRYYDRRCRNLSEDEVEQKLMQGIAYSVRLKVPENQIEFDDLLHGKHRVDPETLDDFIIIRPDRTPVYQLAVVVDDNDMQVSHIIRGDDHLSNTAKQILIYQAMAWHLPRFGHLPLILGPDKVRLSKRHGATSVEEYREQGILPEALINYLMLLGWSSGTDQELMTQEDIINQFDLNRVNKSPSVFDIKKLIWMNGQYLKNTSANRFSELIDKWLIDNHYEVDEEAQIRFYTLVDLQKGRSDNTVSLLESLHVFFSLKHNYDEKGINKFFRKPGSAELLWQLSVKFKDQENGFYQDLDKIESFIRSFAEDKQMSAGAVIHPLRLAITGKMQSPGIFELIYILGKENIVSRIEQAVDFIKNMKFENDK